MATSLMGSHRWCIEAITLGTVQSYRNVKLINYLYYGNLRNVNSNNFTQWLTTNTGIPAHPYMTDFVAC